MSPFDAILDQSRELALERVALALAAALDKADEALAARLEKTQEQEEQALLNEARGAVAAQRGDIESEFETRFQEEFQKRYDKVKKSLKTDADEGIPEEIELALVGEDDLNETLKFNNLAAKLRRHCDAELGALDQRIAVLLGDANLLAEDNPVGPQAICDAYKHACRHAHANVDVRLVLLSLFEELASDEIRETYREMNDLLVENEILPKIKYGVKKKESAAKTPGAPAEEDERAKPSVVAEAAIAMAGGKDVFGILQRVLGAAGGGQAGDGSLSGSNLLESLTKIQLGDVSGVAGANLTAPSAENATTNVLREIKASSVGASLGQVDAMTLDIVSMLFDQIFDDPKIPVGVKGLAGRLQIPTLKVAIADKTLFSRRDHPARQTLDILGDFAARLPADFDSAHGLFPKLEAIVLKVIEDFQDKVDVFVAANEKLRALIVGEEARATKDAEVEAKRVEQHENLAVGRTAAQEEIRARIKQGKAPNSILKFLVREWVKVLLVTHAKHGRDSPAWSEALQTMDDLIWSVEPKATVPERRKLATAVPSLLKRLTAGLGLTGAEDSVRTAFFTELMWWHTFVMGGDAKAKTTSAPAAATPSDPKGRAPTAPNTPPPAVSAASPAASAKPAPPAAPEAEELDFTAAIAIQNPFGEGQVEVDELDFTQAAAAAGALPVAAAAAAAASATIPPAGPKGAKGAAAKPAPKEIALPSKLKEGVWVGIRSARPEEPRQHAKLLFVSPLKTRFLFSDRQGKTVLESNRGDIAKRLRSRDVVILSQQPDSSFFERIIQGVLGKFGAT